MISRRTPVLRSRPQLGLLALLALLAWSSPLLADGPEVTAAGAAAEVAQDGEQESPLSDPAAKPGADEVPDQAPDHGEEHVEQPGEQHSQAHGAEHSQEHSQQHAKEHGQEHGHGSRLSDEAIPLQLDGFPQRPKPLVELGEPFLGTGTLDPGFELPTGAVWQPALLVFGQARIAAQTFDDGASTVSELAARLDLFANLQLSGTERLVLAFRNLDQDGRFTRYTFSSDRPGDEEGFQDELNAEITSLFFEGDFGEIFPNLDTKDFHHTDIGFAVGRQPLLFQEGLLIADSIDALGLTRNTLLPKGTSNFRATLLYGWGDLHRDGRKDRDAQIFGLLTSTDFRKSTVDADLTWVRSDGGGDLVAGGVSAVQRFGGVNTSFRLLGSHAPDGDSALAADGALFLSEVSWTPHGGHDLAYVNTFVALDRFTSAARGPGTGGPLGRAGINFAAVGLGSYGAALSSQAREVAGGAVGYQHFFDDTRKQVLVELGGRIGTADDVADAAALSVRFQAALGRRFVVVVDAFAGWQGSAGPGQPGEESLYGGRLEWVTKF
jgi:hypothetical protein